MTLTDFEKIKPQLQEAFEQAFLKCEEKKPGFLKCWFKMWAEGPK
jgi:hypothetical protein